MAAVRKIKLSALIALSAAVVSVLFSVILYFYTHSFPYVLVSIASFLTCLAVVLLVIRKFHTEKLGLAEKITGTLNVSAQPDEMDDYEIKIAEIDSVIAELKSLYESNFSVSEIYSYCLNLTNTFQRLKDEIHFAKINRVRRNEFLGNVTHELRTPIFAIQLALETLADGAVHDEKVSMDFLHRALNNTERLKELVDDLISISKLETGMKLSRRFFRINPLIKETVDEMSDIVSKKKISVVIESSFDDRAKVFADAEKIKQVLINLIDNSVKYTPPGGTIKVSSGRDDKEYFVTVADTGTGIPKEDIPRIFERFYRVDKTRSRDMGGSGLGLSIVKHILELHNSRITVGSEPGKGSEFTFYLPG